MMNKIHNIMLGVGSIFVIMPSQQPEDYSRFIITETDEERMGNVWEQVGKDIKTATEQFTHENNSILKSSR